MKPLLVLTAVLVLTSGLVKLRAAERVGMGLALLPLVEVIAALALAAVTFARPLTAAGGLTLVVGALVLVVLSSVQVGGAIRKRSRTRELSEGARLRTYLQYLSPSSDPDASGSPSAGSTRE